MDLHFCSQCGISIPQSEIDAGSAKGANGKFYCSEHRGGGVAVATGVTPTPAEGAAKPADEPELLFCANCQVSIPQSDLHSGRARREFGSLLCAGCSKADAGERAARREAVEAEMASDVRAGDPVVARRCSVCSAAVPYAQIASGKAKVDGARVVCERCHAAASLAPAGSGTGDGWLWNFIAVFGIAAAGVLGFLGMQTYKSAKDALADGKSSRVEFERRMSDFDARLSDAAKKAGEPGGVAASDFNRVDADLKNVRQEVDGLREAVQNGDVDLKQRVARLEGQVANLSDMVRGLAARSPGAPVPPVVVEKPPEKTSPPPDKPSAPEPPKKDVPAVSPDVVKYCKDLAESGDDGIRFNAANELGRLKDPASIPALVKALGDDKHYFVRRACAGALSAMKAWNAVPALIKALEDREAYVALRANQALQNVTGNDFGVTQDTPAGQRKTKAAAAEKWWEKNKDHPPDGVCLHPVTE